MAQCLAAADKGEAVASIDIKISLGEVDLDSLHTEEDIRAAAKKLILTALKEICEAAAETMWKEMQKAFSGPGFKANNSASDKQKFIADAGRKYAREASAKDKKELEDYIVEQIRSRKSELG